MPTEESRPIVACMNFDLVRALAGAEMTVCDLDGNEVVLRLYTADELLQAAARSGDKLRALGCDVPPLMSRAKAVELTTPIGAL